MTGFRASDLHVVGVYNNPVGFDVRGRLARGWVQKQLDTGTSLTFVEHALAQRPFLFDKQEPMARHFNLVQLRGGPETEIWLKEPLINRGIAEVLERHDDARTIVWEDADVEHTDRDWVRKTLHTSDRHRVGQTFTNSVDMDPKGNVARNEHGNDVDRSFCAAWLAGDIVMPEGNYTQAPLQAETQSREIFRRHGPAWDARCHFGYSWFASVPVLRKLGRLPDWLITGSGDYNMAVCFAGLTHLLDRSGTPGYTRRLDEFARKCDLYVQQDIGCVDGTIHHFWHGKKTDRQYLSRGQILTASGFDPDRDISIDFHGLPFLCTDNRILRDGMRRYNVQRNEDSVDVF